MSVWYQFDVTVLSPDNSSHHFSYGEKSGIGFDELISKYTNDILLISMTVECTSGSSWIQRVDKTTGKEQTLLIDEFDEREYSFSFHLAQEYKETFPDHKYYDWKLLLNTFDKADLVLTNIARYEVMKSEFDQSDADVDFDNSILEL